jgi:hypothetical protein
MIDKSYMKKLLLTKFKLGIKGKNQSKGVLILEMYLKCKNVKRLYRTTTS